MNTKKKLPNLVTETEGKRGGFLMKQLGPRNAIRFEQYIYQLADEFVEGYNGGFWSFIELSNGGFYMYPGAESVKVTNNMNFSESEMSGKEAGLALTTMALNHLMDSFDENLMMKFNKNMQYINQNDYTGKIRSFLD